MPAVLIFNDLEKTQAEKDFLEEVIDYCQGIYNGFKAIDITLTMVEIRDVSQLYVTARTEQTANTHLINIVTEKLVNLAGEPSFNGVKINRTKLAEMIELPNLGELHGQLMGWLNIHETGFAIEPDLVEIVDDVVQEKDTAQVTIENRNKHYTKTAKGELMATNLNALCTAFNTYLQYIKSGGMIEQSFSGRDAIELLPGVKLNHGIVVVDLQFIRRFE